MLEKTTFINGGNYNIKINLPNLILKLVIQNKFYSETRLARLISMPRKEL